MGYEDLTPEQMEKIKACKTPEDILALAKEEGYELSEAELKAVSGGIDWQDVKETFKNCGGRFDAMNY